MTGDPFVWAVLAAGILAVSLLLILYWWRRAEQGDAFGLTPTQETAPTHFPFRLGPPIPLDIRLPPSLVNGRRIRQGPPLVIPPIHQPLWVAKGWRKANGADEFSGEYTVAGRRWRGLIKRRNGNDYRAFIWNPPMAQIRSNTFHSACFSEKLYDDGIRNGHGCYRVHYHDQPGSLDHAIVTIEMVLAEALNVKV